MACEEMFDFQDGNGLVPAKRHKNKDGSEGGWIALTAKAESTVFISGNAQVFGNAWVFGDVQVFDNARVFGNAWVSGNARVSRDAHVSGDAWEKSPLQIQGTKHFVTMATATELQIGCIKLTIEKWREKRVILGAREGYTPEQIEEYGLYIELAAKLYNLG